MMRQLLVASVGPALEAATGCETSGSREDALAVGCVASGGGSGRRLPNGEIPRIVLSRRAPLTRAARRPGSAGLDAPSVASPQPPSRSLEAE